MHIEISTDNSIDGSEALTNKITEMVQHELAYFKEHITRIEVHLSDANADKTGPDDMHCVLEARLRGRRPTVVKEAAESSEKATRGAAVKMKHALVRILGKRAEHR